MASWLTYPLAFTGSREFDCGKKTEEQCTYYKQRWHFWYIADYVYALPTVAFFLSVLGIFIIGHLVSSQILDYRRFKGSQIWQRCIAVVRYLSYRGFHVKALRWNSAPVGLLLSAAAGTVFFFCMDLIPQPYYWPSEDFGGSPPLGTRSGWMALACMPFVFATASKTNWITLVTGASHEKIQVFHRWTAYAFFLLALMHTFPFIVYHIHWHDMVMEVTMMSTLFYWTGIVALIFQAWLTFASHSVIRNLGYEFFKALHLFAVVVFVIVFFWHCDYTLTSWHYFVATAAVYVPCFVYSWLRTAIEYGFAQKAHIHIEDNGFIRLTIPAVNMKWRPGQHCFLRFTSFGLQAFSSHPFTICSLPPMRAGESSDLVFYIRQGGGLTKKMFNHAQQRPDVAVPVLIDGPYGGINMQRHNEADRLLVIAGGSGAGWMLPLIELFCRRRSNSQLEGEFHDNKTVDNEKNVSNSSHNTSGPQSLRVVLATRDTNSRIWFLQTVSDLLSKYPSNHPSADLDIQVHLTGDAEQHIETPTKIANVTVSRASSSALSSDNIAIEADGESTHIPGKELGGRPDLPSIVHDEGIKAAEGEYSLNVFVCGPDDMQNDVRNAVAKENLGILKGSKAGGVYLHSEHFSWA
ncbi:putative ferric-chelate reductase [Paraphoma chrysanthemicola]|nr:putative ferric-chelate reductase [Paraphoma chrysanthemicola]